MVSAFKGFWALVLAVLLVCRFGFAESEPGMRMTKEQVLAVALPAIEARFPGTTKHRSFHAYVERPGIWGVYVPHPDRPNIRDTGDPSTEVRDRDGKVLKVHLAR
jgi:hypothetical protein